MKKLLPILTFSTLFVGTLQADTLGVYAGYGNWKPEFTGELANGSTESLRFGSSDIAIDEPQQTEFYVALEHPIPFLPNIKVRTQEMSSDGSGSFTGTFGDTSFNGSVDTSFNLDHTDYVLYYELLDNWANLDLGITAREFDGFVRVSGQSDLDPNTIVTDSQDLDVTLPMLYGKARFDFPLTGLSLSVDVNYIGAGGNTVSDIATYLGYETSFGLGIEGGIRTFSMELDDEDDFTADLEFEGVFINAIFHF